MNLLYSKQVKPAQSLKLASHANKTQLLSLAEEKLEKDSFTTELYGVVRSVLFAKEAPDYLAMGQPRKEPYCILLGMSKKEDNLYFRALLLETLSHTLIKEDTLLSKVLKETNRYIQAQDDFVINKDFGVPFFTEENFYKNLNQCLQDSTSFYEKRNQHIDEDFKEEYWNGLVPLHYYKLADFQADLAYSLSSCKEELEKENSQVDIMYLFFQSPFFPQSLNEKKQKELRKAYFMKRSKDAISDDYFENNAKLHSFVEKCIDPFATDNQIKSRFHEMAALAAEERFAWQRKQYLSGTLWYPFYLNGTMSTLNYEHHFLTTLAIELSHRLSSKYGHEQEDEDRLKKVLNELQPFSYSKLKRKYYKKNKEKLTEPFYLNKEINWIHLDAAITGHLNDLKKGKKSTHLYEKIKKQLFVD